MRTRSSFLSVLFLVAIPLLGAKGGCGGDVSLGDDACATSACGGMPELACWDGSSPFTGKCLAKSDGKCGWEPRTCPDKPSETCTTCAIPEIACADGSSPYTGKCLKDATGACIAEKRGCGTSTECTPAECGPGLGAPSYTCEDGTAGGNTGRCLRKEGKCGWEYIDCPRKCDPSECGPLPEIAKCPDGMAPATACKRQSDGMCKWNVAACGVTSCEKVRALARECTSKAQCAIGFHQYNCCGSERAMGYTKTAVSSFDENEKACRLSYPGCGCAAMVTIDDNDKPGAEFDVDCVAGKCTTFVTKGI